MTDARQDETAINGGQSTPEESYSPFFLAAIATFAVFLALLVLDRLELDRRLKAERSDVVNQLESVRSRLDKSLSDPLSRLQAMASQIVAYGDISPDQFNRLAPVLLRGQDSVRSLVVARDTKIEMVYPLAPNKAVLGVDYRSVATQWPHVQLAIRNHTAVLQGPVPLIQGGTGLIAREPVFVRTSQGDERFFGLVSMVVSIPDVLKYAGLTDEQRPIHVAIRGRDGLGAEGDVIFGTADVFDQNPVTLNLNLPYGSWQIGAIPRAGWRSTAGIDVFRALEIIAFVLVTFASFGAAIRARRFFVMSRTMKNQAMRYHFLMGSAGDAIHVLDERGYLQEFSQSFLRERGYSPEEARALHVSDWDVDFTRRQLEDGIRDALKSEMVIESRHRRKDGSVFDVEISLRGVTIDGARMMYCSARDITERKALVQNLKRSNAELEHFAYVASHDLRQPLRMVTSYLTLIERRLGPGLGPDEKTFLDFAVSGAKRMDRMILDILDYSRIGRIDTNLNDVDLGRILTAAVTNLHTAIVEASATVTLPDHLPVIQGYESELERLFQNLISNAVKFRSPDRPCQVSIECRPQTAGWVVGVTDNGIGIAADQQGRLFNIFQRLVSTEEYEGTGIGLASCRKIAEHHGGRIWVESVENQGSTFWVALPSAP